MKKMLAVTMIVRNEEKNLSVCLDALAPLISKEWCSLYITDTGSEDLTVEISKKYTDNILHFEWCSDFSAARNHALESIDSEWIMYLDADDIFADVKPFVDFFESGEYRNFDGATFVKRNLADRSGHTFTEQSALQLFRFDGTARFVRPVHEFFDMHCTRVRNLAALDVHYGYIRDDGSAQRHGRRNALILEEWQQRHSDDPMVYAQLCDSFAMCEDYASALKYIRMGDELESIHGMMKLSLIVKRMAVEFACENYHSEKSLLEKYLAEKNRSGIKRAPDCEAYYYAGMSAFRIYLYEEAEKQLSGYMNAVSEYSSAPSEYANNTHEFSCADRTTVNRAVNAMTEIKAKLGKYTEAYGFYQLSSNRKAVDTTMIADIIKKADISSAEKEKLIKENGDRLYDINGIIGFADRKYFSAELFYDAPESFPARLKYSQVLSMKKHHGDISVLFESKEKYISPVSCYNLMLCAIAENNAEMLLFFGKKYIGAVYRTEMINADNCALGEPERLVLCIDAAVNASDAGVCISYLRKAAAAMPEAAALVKTVSMEMQKRFSAEKQKK